MIKILIIRILKSIFSTIAGRSSPSLLGEGDKRG
jgi:hypothetical protein